MCAVQDGKIPVNLVCGPPHQICPDQAAARGFVPDFHKEVAMQTWRAFLFLGLLAVSVLACSLFDRLAGQVTGSDEAVLLNEVLFFPSAGADAFVELKSTGRISLDGLTLTNESGQRFSLPSGLEALTPDRYLLIVFDASSRVEGDVVHAESSDFLNPESGSVELTASDGTVLDRVAWGVDRPASVNLSRGGFIADLEPGTSIGRFPLSIGIDPLEWTIFAPAQVTAGSLNPQPGVEVMLPLNGAVMGQLNFELTWYAAPGALEYNVQVSNDETFSALTIDETVSEPALTVELQPGAYFWRVQAVPAEGPALSGADGAAVDFSPIQKITVDPGFSITSHLAAPQRQTNLAVPYMSQHKDTAMLLLETKNETGEHAWNVPHPNYDRADPADNKNCALAAIAMISAYMGGDLSQDRLGYELYQDAWPGPEYDLNYGRGLDASQIDQLLTFALDAVPIYGPKPETPDEYWAAVQGEIDAGRPILGTFPGHAFVITGYYEDTSARYIMINDSSLGGYAVDIEVVGWTIYYMLSPDSVPVLSEPEIGMDSDGDGIVDFDETERFGTNPDDRDSDKDNVPDQADVRASIYDIHFGYAFFGDVEWRDYDGDGIAMELDEDSDGGGCFDGLEDFDLNGKYEDPETYNFDKEDDACFWGTDELLLDTTSVYDDGSIHQRLHTFVTFSLRAIEAGKLEGLAQIKYTHTGEDTSDICSGTLDIGTQLYHTDLKGEFYTTAEGGTFVRFDAIPDHGPTYIFQWNSNCPTEADEWDGWSWGGTSGTLIDGVYDYFGDFSSNLPTGKTGEFWLKTHMEQGRAQ